MGAPSAVCWDWALSPAGALVLVLLLAAPFVLRAKGWLNAPRVEAGLIGLFAAFVVMGGCKGLVLTGILP